MLGEDVFRKLFFNLSLLYRIAPRIVSLSGYMLFVSFVKVQLVIIMTCILSDAQVAKSSDREFANQVVRQHNVYRRQHGNVNFK